MRAVFKNHFIITFSTLLKKRGNLRRTPDPYSCKYGVKHQPLN